MGVNYVERLSTIYRRYGNKNSRNLVAGALALNYVGVV